MRMSVGLGEVDLGIALDQRRQRDGGEVVGAHVLERALGRAPDRRANRVHDDGVGHRSVSFFNHGAAKATTVGRRDAPHPRAVSRPRRPVDLPDRYRPGDVEFAGAALTVVALVGANLVARRPAAQPSERPPSAAWAATRSANPSKSRA